MKNCSNSECVVCDFCGVAYDIDSSEAKKFTSFFREGSGEVYLEMCMDCFVLLLEENM